MPKKQGKRTALSDEDFQRYVEEIKVYDQQIKIAQWAIGDTLLKAIPSPGAGGPGDEEARELLQRFAEATGISYATLSDYRRTAAAYQGPERRLDRSWSIHRELATEQDRAELLGMITSWNQARQFKADRREEEFQAKYRIPGMGPIPLGNPSLLEQEIDELRERIAELDPEERRAVLDGWEKDLEPPEPEPEPKEEKIKQPPRTELSTFVKNVSDLDAKIELLKWNLLLVDAVGLPHERAPLSGGVDADTLMEFVVHGKERVERLAWLHVEALRLARRDPFFERFEYRYPKQGESTYTATQVGPTPELTAWLAEERQEDKPVDLTDLDE